MCLQSCGAMGGKGCAILFRRCATGLDSRVCLSKWMEFVKLDGGRKWSGFREIFREV